MGLVPTFFFISDCAFFLTGPTVFNFIVVNRAVECGSAFIFCGSDPVVLFNVDPDSAYF